MTAELNSAYERLHAHHARLHRLWHLQAIASVDRLTVMPSGGAAARAAAQGELATIIRQHQDQPDLVTWLGQASREALDNDQRANLREMEREHRLACAVPAALAQRRQQVTGACMAAWGPARKANDWPAFAAAFTPVLALVREEAQALGNALGCARYDALLQRHEPGLTMASLQPLLDDVAAWLPDLLRRTLRLQAVAQSEAAILEPQGPFPVEAQRRLGEQVMRLLGFDFNAGRLDSSAHPFTGGVPEDVRLTTRYDEARCLPALLATMHETGHACYQQGLPRAWLGQPAGEPRSAALHESQALCFERQLAPSPAFVNVLAPMLARAFGEQAAFEPNNVVRLMTRVRPGKLRVEADELTYPAHVVLRVQIERALVEGSADADDIPALWDDGMQTLLGVDTRGDHASGALQDVHWSGGNFGYFPAYLLGALHAAQWFAAMRQQSPGLDERIGQGDCSPVSTWLRENIWSLGSLPTVEELTLQAAGRPLGTAALAAHLTKRYAGEPPPA